MEALEKLLREIDGIRFSGSQKCIELLDNRLQDAMLVLENCGHRASGELLDLKQCSWVLHERYHMDDEEELKWTFHHTKHRILRDIHVILDFMQRSAEKLKLAG